ncbi:HIT family protein [Roseibium limicola]|uniref:HIT family protein n=1 Tax=Roseibium limicola TaxID=2816037 RepID=A0A939J651_9HYPH|nr:HIT family protein [Roseibium limicola]MBO0344752.1 HIT family protein [Roseibium limicola]
MTTSSYDDQNIFAKILRGDLPSHKLYEDDSTLAIMDIMPRGDGHCLVLPKAPSRNLLEMDPAALSATMATVQKLANAVKQAFEADGVTLEQYTGAAAGQTVFHTHFHIIPRIEGVALKPHAGKMADNDILSEHARKIRAALS